MVWLGAGVAVANIALWALVVAWRSMVRSRGMPG